MATLLAFIEDDIDDELIEAVRLGLDGLRQSREFASVPTFVHEVEKATGSDDSDIETLGAFVVLEPNGSPRESVSLGDAEAFVSWWRQLSCERHKTVGFELDGDAIGWIDDGDGSDLEIGFLGPWREHVRSPG